MQKFGTVFGQCSGLSRT